MLFQKRFKKFPDISETEQIIFINFAIGWKSMCKIYKTNLSRTCIWASLIKNEQKGTPKHMICSLFLKENLNIPELLDKIFCQRNCLCIFPTKIVIQNSVNCFRTERFSIVFVKPILIFRENVINNEVSYFLSKSSTFNRQP